MGPALVCTIGTIEVAVVIFMSVYTSLIRPLAFRLEAEQAHHLAIKLGANMAWAAPGLAPAAGGFGPAA